MPIVRFSNEIDHPIDLQVEPWGGMVEIPAGATFSIIYPDLANGEDTSSIALHEDMIRFFCAGADYQLEINGTKIDI